MNHGRRTHCHLTKAKLSAQMTVCGGTDKKQIIINIYTFLLLLFFFFAAIHIGVVWMYVFFQNFSILLFCIFNGYFMYLRSTISHRSIKLNRDDFLNWKFIHIENMFVSILQFDSNLCKMFENAFVLLCLFLLLLCVLLERKREKKEIIIRSSISQQNEQEFTINLLLTHIYIHTCACKLKRI